MNYSLDAVQCQNFRVSSEREWMLANGLGGYAMGTVSGVNTRRYHGLLVAATNPPADRTVLLANVEIQLETDGNPIGLSCNQYQGAVYPEGYQYLHEFRLTDRDATWVFRTAGCELTKTLVFHTGVNACTLHVANTGKRAFALTLRPLVCHKPYHKNFRQRENYPVALTFPKDKTVLEEAGIALHLSHPKAMRVPSPGWYYRFEYHRELERGLDPRDDLFCPCELRYEMAPGESAVLTASTAAGVRPLSPQEPPQPTPSLKTGLIEASEKFFVKTKSRTSVIAGYPWFADWGRDTMISIPGLCLHTGRVKEAKEIVADYASQMKQGLIPNRFVEDGQAPEYNTVDATLWFAHAIHRILEAEWDDKFAIKSLKWLADVFEWHQKGTLYGIKVDPTDGLLTQGEEGVQLTWMDAKVGDWVVTPRNGKPVEINGLWINALRIMAQLAERLARPSNAFKDAADLAEENFEKKFWKETIGHYLDTAEPDDASLRPNQVIAMALPFSPCDPEHAKRALEVVTRELLTEFGLRTLGPSEPGYRGRFAGPLSELDAAYHQGTVWPWLLGPYVTAMVKLTGDKREAKHVLAAAKTMLWEEGLGGISEVYDGDEPRSPGGCPWQAWSVAEILRAWIEDAGGK